MAVIHRIFDMFPTGSLGDKMFMVWLAFGVYQTSENYRIWGFFWNVTKLFLEAYFYGMCNELLELCFENFVSSLEPKHFALKKLEPLPRKIRSCQKCIREVSFTFKNSYIIILTIRCKKKKETTLGFN